VDADVVIAFRYPYLRGYCGYYPLFAYEIMSVLD